MVLAVRLNVAFARADVALAVRREDYLLQRSEVPLISSALRDQAGQTASKHLGVLGAKPAENPLAQVGPAESH